MIDQEDSADSLIDQPQQELSNQTLDYGKPPRRSNLDRAVMNAHRAADEAWRLLHAAMIEGRASKIQILLSIHNKAIDGLFTAESAYREELQQRKILIPLTEAMEMARRGFNVILQRLQFLPQNVAHQCNPSDPSGPMTVLESECTAILADAQKVYASWSDDRTPASNASQL
jgi:hypothetical protein